MKGKCALIDRFCLDLILLRCFFLLVNFRNLSVTDRLQSQLLWTSNELSTNASVAATGATGSIKQSVALKHRPCYCCPSGFAGSHIFLLWSISPFCSLSTYSYQSKYDKPSRHNHKTPLPNQTLASQSSTTKPISVPHASDVPTIPLTKLSALFPQHFNTRLIIQPPNNRPPLPPPVRPIPPPSETQPNPPELLSHKRGQILFRRSPPHAPLLNLPPSRHLLPA